MQLTQYTDFGLRALIALAINPGERLTVTEISSAYSISRNHLVKVVARLADLGYVETVRGKGGGVRLARAPADIRLGEVVRNLEAELGVVECLEGGGGSCMITSACRLKGVLRDATARFLDCLDEYTLADAMKPRIPMARLLGIPVRVEPGV